MKLKTLTIIAAICLGIGTADAQITKQFAFQGVLKDGTGNFTGTVDVTANIYAVSGGASVYTEAHTGVAVANGLITINVGSVTPLDVDFADAYELGVTVGSDPEMTPRVPLLSAPAAINAAGVQIDGGGAGVGEGMRHIQGLALEAGDARLDLQDVVQAARSLEVGAGLDQRQADDAVRLLNLAQGPIGGVEEVPHCRVEPAEVVGVVDRPGRRAVAPTDGDGHRAGVFHDGSLLLLPASAWRRLTGGRVGPIMSVPNQYSVCHGACQSALSRRRHH